MIDKDFEQFTVLENKEFPLATKYAFEDSVFYVEPMFYTQMQGMKTLRPEEASENSKTNKSQTKSLKPYWKREHTHRPEGDPNLQKLL